MGGSGAIGCASPSNNPMEGTGGSGNSAGTTGDAGTTGMAGTTGTAGTTGSGGSSPTTCGPQTAPGPSGGANFPFPQHKLSANCGYPTSCNDADVMTSWNTFKTKMIVNNGGGLRVQRPENSNDTVSEGIAYGMLMAVYLVDKTTFDGLWAYAKAHKNGKGLMNWHIDANGGTVGNGAATDADEDMAFALMMADKQWGGYASDASGLVGSILASEVTSSNLLLPDDSGNMSSDINPSYFAPAYYKLFATYNARWTMVADQSYTMLNRCANATTGLVADWCTQQGGTSGRSNPPRYYYDAARTPFRIAQDACWNNDSRAVTYLAKVAAFFNGLGPTGIRDGYNLDGTSPGANAGIMVFEGPVGVGMMPSKATYASFLLQNYTRVAVTSKSGTSSAYNYYNGAWGVLTLMMMTGNMTPF
ncbi:MAG TPA: glycosyl hydrolase family 8 [Polyangia bacterium]|nr:glycosyl hydrolase family 8 [Polyangia bacterium]